MPEGVDETPELHALRQRLADEEAAYAVQLQALDALVQFPLPLENLPEQPAQMQRLNALWEGPAVPPLESRLWGGLWRALWARLGPRLERQQDFNSVLVQVLNGQLDQSARLHAHLRELAGALIRYLQRLLPVIDARDRMASGLATARAELILEAFDRRLESLGRRVDGLRAMRDRLEVLGEEVKAVRATLAAAQPSPQVAQTAVTAVGDAGYIAFENRYRGSREEVRAHLSSYAALFRERPPVVDLGCGRGEFLELLQEQGTAARGVEGNVPLVQECRARGLNVMQGDLVDFLRAEPSGTLGGVFAAQVAEHLPPRVLQAMLCEAHRVLRPGGLLAVETVNPRSVIGFLEVYTRDLTHERPLHPDTLRFVAAAAGFLDVRIEWRAPIEPAARLQAVPTDGLPPHAAQILNENTERLNGLLYGPQEYVLLASR